MNIEIKKNILLKDYSTFKIGGLAKFFCCVKELAELNEALAWALENREKIFILGGGSNVLFSDDGWDGLVVKIMNHELRIMNHDKEKYEISCAAGVSLGKLVNFSVENSLTGLEWAAGIPGTVGGALRGNAAAFGGQIGDVVKSVSVVDINSLEIKKYSKEECEFGYRNSGFKYSRGKIIWDCEIELNPGEKDEILKRIEEVAKKRVINLKQPELGSFPSAGSVFKNPVANKGLIEVFEKDKEVKCKDNKVPAGWLIDRCGLKGKRIGDAMVSENQANFIVNIGNAKAEDVFILISLVKQKVRNKFRTQLEEEIEIVH